MLKLYSDACPDTSPNPSGTARPRDADRSPPLAKSAAAKDFRGLRTTSWNLTGRSTAGTAGSCDSGPDAIGAKGSSAGNGASHLGLADIRAENFNSQNDQLTPFDRFSSTKQLRKNAFTLFFSSLLCLSFIFSFL